MLATITNHYVIGGIVLLVTFPVLYLVSLSWEELSYVLPLTAANYVLVTILAISCWASTFRLCDGRAACSLLSA